VDTITVASGPAPSATVFAGDLETIILATREMRAWQDENGNVIIDLMQFDRPSPTGARLRPGPFGLGAGGVGLDMA
jgi:hypothetical protein